MTDARSTKRTFGFQNSLGVKRLTGITQPCPECSDGTSSLERTYDANGNLATFTDFKLTRTELSYDPARHLETSRIEAAGTTAESNVAIEWHPTYRLPVRTAEPSRETLMSYDGNGNMVARSVVEATSGSPRTWTYTSDVNGQVTAVDGPRTDVSDITTYTYYPVDDAAAGRRGMLATIIDALGHVTEISDYNAHGNPLRVVDPNGLQTELAYDMRQRLISQDIGGELTSYEYDPADQLTKTTLPDGSTLSFSYDAAHRLTAVSDSAGNRIAYTLDLMGNRMKEDALDPSGMLAQTRAREYDALNRLAKVIGATAPAAQITRHQYDAAGNLTRITDPLGRVTSISYDALGRLIGVTDPGTGVTQLGRTPLDQLASVTDARGLVTVYQRDGLDNLSSQSSSDTGTTRHAYDAAGNLLSSTDARGIVATYTYDALNRLTSAQFTPPAGSTLVSLTHAYEYDQGANGIGHLTRISDPSGTTSFAYDAHGRLTQDARVTGGVSYTTAYRYDSAGRLRGQTYPSGQRVDYTLDSLGRISAITTTRGNNTRLVLAAISYRPFGEVQSFVFGNGQPYARSFDLDGRIRGYSLGERTQVLSLDAAGRITALSDAANPASATQMGYDALDRLTSFITPSSSQNFSYDPVGNRLTQTIGPNTYSYTYPQSSNRLSSVSGPTPLSYTYDAAGHLAATGKHILVHDARGRLSQVINAANGALLAGYQVNALGERVRKTLGTGATRVFLYDSAGHLIGEAGAGGQPLWEHIWLGDLPVAWMSADQDEDGVPDEADNCISVANPNQRDVDADGIGEMCDGDVNRDGRVDDADALVIQQCVVRLRPYEAKYDLDGDGRASASDALRVAYRKGLPPGPSGLKGEAAEAQLFYVYPDHLGTPRVVTDTQNRVRWRWDNSDAFGANLASEDPDGDFLKLAYPLRFPGQYFDKETGLHYNYYRDYDPSTGRYLQSDPIGLRGGPNTYAYVGGSPLRFIDPFGLAVGHHLIPLEVFSALPLPPGARDIFDRTTTGPLPDGVHMYDEAHRAYSDAIRRDMNDWLNRSNMYPARFSIQVIWHVTPSGAVASKVTRGGKLPELPVAQIRVFQEIGYWPLFVTDSNLYYQHTLCGEHAVQGAISPNSGKPLLRYFALDLLDDRLGLGSFSARRLDLFFAWSCEISRDVFTYRIHSEDRIGILRYRQGRAYLDFPYANYPTYFPARLFELRKVTPEEQKTICRVNRRTLKPSTIHDDRPDLIRPQHQICGEPYLVNSSRQVTCPICQGGMSIYASASDETMSERGFVHSNFVQVLFHLCTSCAVVTAYQLAD